MDKDIRDYKYKDSLTERKLEAFVEQAAFEEVDVSNIKKKTFMKIHGAQRRRQRVLMFIASMAATLLLFIGVRYLIGEDTVGGALDGDSTGWFADTFSEVMVVPVGEKATLMLNDGTKIIANSRTVIRYPKQFTGNSRNVYVKGEAYFEVAHDTSCPFYVHSDHFRIKVLGTTFNVNNYDETDAQVVLVEGTVELETTADDRVKMKPGDLVSLNDKGFVAKHTVNVNNSICWMQGALLLDGDNIASIVKRLHYYYGVDIRIENQDLSEERYYGKLVLGTRLDEVLHTIKNMTSLRIERQNGVIYLK